MSSPIKVNFRDSTHRISFIARTARPQKVNFMRKKRKKSLKKYRVWFYQVNASHEDVEALSEADAVAKAKRIWRINNYPELSEVEELT